VTFITETLQSSKHTGWEVGKPSPFRSSHSSTATHSDCSIVAAALRVKNIISLITKGKTQSNYIAKRRPLPTFHSPLLINSYPLP